ncbi:MAG: tripartite tricarboxylate transporter substrate-binding protein [Pseudomonadota bacterium]|nr:tripartite tricarboxylate transporter substrate-binding protein [Pseudomonadota bacterium]
MTFFSKLAVLAAATLCAVTASAQTYPVKPVRVVVTTVPGPLDAFARIVMQQLEKRLKQTFIVDNRAGAGGNLGADIVAKAAADGYTLLFALDTTFTVNPSLYRKMPFDVAKDLTIIAVPVTYSQALAVNPNVKAGNVAEFVKLAKSTHMSYASGGNGSPSHLTMAAFMATAGLNMTHVPYKGTGASVIDVMAGQVDSVFAVGSGILPQAKAGKLRALAVSGETRSSAAPELPTIAESGYPGFNASFAYVLAAPAGTPDEIVQLLAREVALAMNSPEVRELDRQADYAPTNLTQPQSGAWLTEMRKHWADVVQKSGITLD